MHLQVLLCTLLLVQAIVPTDVLLTWWVGTKVKHLAFPMFLDEHIVISLWYCEYKSTIVNWHFAHLQTLHQHPFRTSTAPLELQNLTLQRSEKMERMSCACSFVTGFSSLPSSCSSFVTLGPGRYRRRLNWSCDRLKGRPLRVQVSRQTPWVQRFQRSVDSIVQWRLREIQDSEAMTLVYLREYRVGQSLRDDTGSVTAQYA